MSEYQQLYASLMSQLQSDIMSGRLASGQSSFNGGVSPGMMMNAQDFTVVSGKGPFDPGVGVKGGPFDTGPGLIVPGGKGPPPSSMPSPMPSPGGFTSPMPSSMPSQYGFGKGPMGAIPPPPGKGPYSVHLPAHRGAAPPPPSTPPPSYNCTLCKLAFPSQNAQSLHLHQVHGHRHIAVRGAENSYV